MYETIQTPTGYQLRTDHPIECLYNLDGPTPSVSTLDFSKIKAILMDMDGSSTDTEKLVLESMRRVFEEALHRPGFDYAPEDYPHIIGSSKTNHFLYLIKTYGLNPADLPHYLEIYYQKYHVLLADSLRDPVNQNLVEPMPGLKELLLWTKRHQIKVALVTASVHKEVSLIMPVVFQKMGFKETPKEFYNALVAAEDVGELFLKPHPNLYLMAQYYLQVTGNECLAIEDSAPGITAARFSGASVFAVPHHQTSAHSFEMANLGLAKGGLPEVLGILKEKTGKE
jgi:beta-phosphoglucomutase-like phosphatase (HAD superfamily)